jgi:hypothetical protein
MRGEVALTGGALVVGVLVGLLAERLARITVAAEALSLRAVEGPRVLRKPASGGEAGAGTDVLERYRLAAAV